MIFGLTWADWLTVLLVLFFAGNGVANIVGPQPMREGFAHWGYPPYWHLVNGALQLGIAVLLAFPTTRLFGFGLAVLLCIAIYVTLIRHRELAHLPPSVVLLVVLAVTAWGLYGLPQPGGVA